MAGGGGANGGENKHNTPREKGNEYFEKTKYVPKHITVDITGKTAAKTGGNLSTRQVFDIIDEKGNKTRGYFTENNYVLLKSNVQKAIRKVTPPAGYEQLGEEIFDAFSNKDRINAFAHEVHKNLDPDDKILKIETEDSQKAFDNHAAGYRKLFEKYVNLTDDIKKAYDEKGELYKYVRAVIGNIQNSASDFITHTFRHKMDEGVMLNRRNNAMSAFAGLLHMSGIVADSTLMTIKDGDKVIHGSCMVGAKGYSHKMLSRNTEGFGNKDMEITGQMLEQLSDLQVLDFLCANVDRHMGNMFYQTDVSEPGKIKLVGVQGIDNDASFGKFDKNSVSEGYLYDRMSLLKDIKYINKKTADEILKLKEEELEDKIRLAGLSAAEVDATVERFRLLKEKIEKNEIKIMQSAEDWEKEYKSPTFRNDIVTEEGDNANIFKIAFNLQSWYNRMHGMSEYPFGEPDGPGEDKIPEVHTVSVDDGAGLKDHIESFERIQNDINKTIITQQCPESYLQIREQFKATLDSMKECRKKLAEKRGQDSAENILDEKDRTKLTKQLSELNTMSVKCLEDIAEKNASADYTNIVKNIRAFSQFAADAIDNDAIEEKKNITSKKLADDYKAELLLVDPDREKIANERKLTYIETPHTFDSLAAREADLEGRAKEQYRNMWKTFREKGDLSLLKDESEIKFNCNEIIIAANAYLAYKIPKPEAEKKLSENEKQRVQFAKDLIQYAQANRKEADNKLREQDFIFEDTKKIDDFISSCKYDVTHYKSAVKNKRIAAENIFDSKEKIIEGLKNIIFTSDRYAPNHPIQKNCAKAIRDLKEFTEIFTEVSEALTGNKSANFYKALGMDDALAKAMHTKLKQVLEKGSVLEDKKRAERRLTYKTTKHTFANLSQREEGMAGRSQQDYKNMWSEFKAKGDLSAAGSDAERKQYCEDLIKAAQKYIEHKIPAPEAENALKPNERKRVRFARDLIEYANVNRLKLENKEKTEAFKREDINELKKFSDTFKQLADAYSSAEGENKTKAAQDILAKKEEFASGLKNVFNISGLYSTGDPMQVQCASALKDVHGFMDTFLTLTKAAGKNVANVYEALGMEPDEAADAAEKAQSVTKAGEMAQEKLLKAEKKPDAAKEVIAPTEVKNNNSPIFGGMEEFGN